MCGSAWSRHQTLIPVAATRRSSCCRPTTPSVPRIRGQGAWDFAGHDALRGDALAVPAFVWQGQLHPELPGGHADAHGSARQLRALEHSSQAETWLR